MTKRFAVVLLAAAMLLGPAQAALAALSAVGPVSPATGYFPVWYQDATRQLELCLSTTPSPDPAAAGAPMCVVLPVPGFFDPALPVAFPINFPDEAFYFVADAAIPGVALTYRAGVEAAFATGGVVDGAQITFARIRVRATVPTTGTYTITHPYGVETVTVTDVATRSINLTRDIGVGANGVFTGALAGDIGPFLTAAGGLITVGAETFIGDPNVLQLVTGSPFSTNFVRIVGPGVDLTTDQFALGGKVFGGVLPANLSIDRSTYSRTATGSQVDVFSTATPGATLSVRNTLAPGTETPMTPDGNGKFYAKETPASIPPFVVVTATQTGATPTQLASPVVDVVKITKAQYALDTKTLLIQANSSDQAAPPTLTAVGFGPVAGGTLSITPVAQPPARVTVVSSQGGSDTEPVLIVPTAPVAGNLAPSAVNDTATTAQRTAVNIAVLTNDVDPDGNTPLTVATLTQPALGTGAVSLVGTTVTYTPPAVFAGIATFTYQAADSLGALSNVATVTVTVTNQLPVAVDDNASTTTGTAVAINLTANDTDADGNTPLAVASFTQPAAGNGTVSALGSTSVTYTPPAGFTGTASFTYQVRDSLGALSNVATVRVTVSNVVVVENITATAQASVDLRKLQTSWTIQGTTNILTPIHTMTVRLTRTGAQIGVPATTDTKGRWKLTAAKSLVNPVAGDTITVTSSLGRTQTFLVTVK